MSEANSENWRATSEAMNDIADRKFSVLDAGFVRVVDYMGNDDAIVQAARISYGKGTKRVSEDRGLIRYLIRHRHTTPFEMCEIKLHVRAPMDCWRQWIRHRTANVNEYSTRYSEAIDASQATAPEKWRAQSDINRQGSGEFLPAEIGLEMSKAETDLHLRARQVYEERIKAGVAREQARKDLPLSTYTEAYWKIDLHNLLHFLSLRMDAHAQSEIREYATVIGREIVSRWCPITWEAFEDYRLGAMFLSRIEIEIITAVNDGRAESAMDIARRADWLNLHDGKLSRNREREECEGKLKRLGIRPPW